MGLGVSGFAEPSALTLTSMHLAILCPLIIIIWSCIPLQLQTDQKLLLQKTFKGNFKLAQFSKEGDPV